MIALDSETEIQSSSSITGTVQVNSKMRKLIVNTQRLLRFTSLQRFVVCSKGKVKSYGHSGPLLREIIPVSVA